MRRVPAIAGLVGVLALLGGAAILVLERPATEVTTAEPSSTTSSSSTTTTRPSTTTTALPATTTSATTTTATPTTTAPPPPTTVPAPTLPPLTGGDRSVYVLGDSVLLGARETVPAALAGWVVTMDTVGSRRLPQGIEVLRAVRPQLGAVVVIQQGNNYIEAEGSFAAQIDEAMRVLEGVPRVVWLTVAERWPSRVAINQAIRAAPSRWPNAVVADWAVLIAQHPEYAEDLLHLSPSGRVAIASLIASKVGPPPP